MLLGGVEDIRLEAKDTKKSIAKIKDTPSVADLQKHQPKPNDFGRKISLNFGEDLFFFFWRPPDFGRKKPLNV